jgi:ATP-dependent RNA helicase RhlB
MTLFITNEALCLKFTTCPNVTTHDPQIPYPYSSTQERFLTKIRFDSLPIPEPVLQGIRDAGFDYCTPIQSKTLPITLSGKDVAGQAQTGTGKTAAFLITVFTKLIKNPTKPRRHNEWVAPRALIVAPTRELARQIEKDALLLGSHCNLQIVCVYGGVDYEKQKNLIKDGVDVMIVTPGRFIDFYKQRFFSLKSVEILVIDEADRMFDMGFIADIRYIFRNTVSYDKRQSMLFSATLSYRVMELCYEHMNMPEKVAIEPEKATVAKIKQILYHVGSHEKFKLLLGVLKKEGASKTIVFCNTKDVVELLESQLRHNGYSAGQLSGDIQQRKRIQVLDDFTKGVIDILIATDVASRGLHIDNISHVVNYDLPQDAEDYIHRIGRTARAGAEGTAISFACEDYVQSLEDVEHMLKQKIPTEWPSEDLFVQELEGTPSARPRRKYSGGGGGRRPPPRRSGGGKPHGGGGSGGRRPPPRRSGGKPPPRRHG